MRAEEGRDVTDLPLPVQATHDAQHLQLVLDGKPVARLGLDGRRARAQEPTLAPQGRREQFLFTCCTRPTHGRAYAAARRGDLLVARARCALLELVRAVAREDRVRVRVNEAGHDDPSARVNNFTVRADVLPFLRAL